jgi:hypothetical protein
MCRKVRHNTTWGAAQHVLYLFRTGKAHGSGMGIYYCGKCDAYHVTSRGDHRCIAVINKSL